MTSSSPITSVANPLIISGNVTELEGGGGLREETAENKSCLADVEVELLVLSFDSQQRRIMQNDREKTYQRSSPWRKEYHQEWISYGGFGVMQSNLNPHKTGHSSLCPYVPDGTHKHFLQHWLQYIKQALLWDVAEHRTSHAAGQSLQKYTILLNNPLLLPENSVVLIRNDAFCLFL
ncbi:hypothetical protein YC2023_005044 [Brassica napus]